MSFFSIVVLSSVEGVHTDMSMIYRSRAGEGYDNNRGTGMSGTGSGSGTGNTSGISGRGEESWEAIRKANTPY